MGNTQTGLSGKVARMRLFGLGLFVAGLTAGGPLSTARAADLSLALTAPFAKEGPGSHMAAEASTGWESDYSVRKMAHVSLSAVGTEAFLKVGQALNKNHEITFLNRILASSMMLGVGLGKEVYDARITGLPINTRDLGFDALGIRERRKIGVS